MWPRSWKRGLCGADDRRLAQRCREEDRCLVTLDLDYANPMVFDPRRHRGIAVLRLARRPAMADIHAGLQTLVGALTRASVVGRLWFVEYGRVREYQPPDEA